MRMIVLALVLMSSCGVPTAPTQRNPGGSPRKPGDPLQPWIRTDVQTGDFRLPQPPQGDAK